MLTGWEGCRRGRDPHIIGGGGWGHSRGQVSPQSPSRGAASSPRGAGAHRSPSGWGRDVAPLRPAPLGPGSRARRVPAAFPASSSGGRRMLRRARSRRRGGEGGRPMAAAPTERGGSGGPGRREGAPHRRCWGLYGRARAAIGHRGQRPPPGETPARPPLWGLRQDALGTPQLGPGGAGLGGAAVVPAWACSGRAAPQESVSAKGPRDPHCCPACPAARGRLIGRGLL